MSNKSDRIKRDDVLVLLKEQRRISQKRADQMRVKADNHGWITNMGHVGIFEFLIEMVKDMEAAQ